MYAKSFKYDSLNMRKFPDIEYIAIESENIISYWSAIYLKSLLVITLLLYLCGR